MDNITHSLTGLAMARAGLNRFSPRATLLLLVSANAPDSDIAAALHGAFSYLQAHRGYTHSLLGLPVMAALSVLVVAAICREKLPWWRAWALCCIGVGSHLLLDLTNSYGVRLLLPFSARWFHLDINNLYDFVILAVLLLAAIWPLFESLVTGEIGARGSRGRGTAIAALSFFVVFDLARAILHGRAVAELNAFVYDDAAPIRAAALASRSNPFEWRGIVETADSVRMLPVNTFRNLDLDAGEQFRKMPRDAVIEAARRTAPFRYFEYFSRFPIWSEEPVWIGQQRATRVDLTDLQFGRPGGGSFHCIAVVGGQNRVLLSYFTFASGNHSMGESGK